MNDLVKISKNEIGGEQVECVDARELHLILEVKSQYSSWIRRRINEAQIDVNIDYIEFYPSVNKTSEGGRPSSSVLLTLDAAKHISMLERTEKGKEVRNHFIKVEKRARELYENSAIRPTTEQNFALSAFEANLKIAELINSPKHLALIETTKQIEKKHGVDYSAMIGGSSHMDAIEDKEMFLEPSEIGKRVGMEGTVQKRGRHINLLLASNSLQFRRNGEWIATEYAVENNLCTRHAWANGSKSGYNYKWRFDYVKNLYELEQLEPCQPN